MLRDKRSQQAESEALRNENEELRALLWRFTVAEDASTDLIREAMIGRARLSSTLSRNSSYSKAVVHQC
jgi:hypothetical protein